MEVKDLKTGDKVKARYRKYGVHSVVGEVFEISADKGEFKGTWASIRVTGGNLNDPHVGWLVKNKVSVLVALKDIVAIIKP